MSELLTTIKDDLTTAIKAHDEQTRSTLRMVMAAIKNKRIELGEEPDDDAVLEVLVKEKKTRQESIEQYRLGGREDLVQQEENEIVIINRYLPAQLEESEVGAIVELVISELGAKSIQDMGKVMGALSGKLKGKADMKQVSALVKDKLS